MLGSILHIGVLAFWYLHRFTHSVVDLLHHWSNVTQLAYFGCAKIVLCCGPSGQMTICHGGGMLKDAMAGLLGSNCLLLAGECSSKRLGLVIYVLGRFV